MNVVDLHPEELLDKEARLELTDVERARLDAHCGQCTACRAERRLRLDFAEERAGDGIEDAPFSAELVAIALGSAKGKATHAAEKTAAPAIRPAARPRRLARAWLLAAAALLGVTAAAAHQANPGSWLRRTVGIDAPATLETPPTAMKPARITAPITTPIAAPEQPPIADAPPVAAAPELEPAPAAAPAIAPAKTPTAAAMFDEANDARRRGDYARAIDLHHRLQARHPSSREAQVSRATLGRLLLDRGDLASALQSFDDYLAHGHGELDEAVLVGRATSLDRLGRASEARRAWQALLDAFPSSPYAEHARSRTEQ